MKTTIIIIWLIILTIFMLRIHGDMKERPTNGELLDLEIRLQVVELNQNHKAVSEVIERVERLFRERRIVPVGNGILLAVEENQSLPNLNDQIQDYSPQDKKQ